MIMKWRQKIKNDRHGEKSMILQVRKWWMPFYVDCWYKINNQNSNKYYQLKTDIKYPPEIEHINKEGLYYYFLNLMYIKI